ncbi:dihydrodipicolinate synthase family protein [Candidatus Sumerlaeota bacterium]|nr:dihydrodipicolinate synthase family protein [Candidatus Sumerlaeota bacterium]
MTPAPFRGVCAAALTLYDTQEKVHWDAWSDYLRWLCDSGLDGVLIMGTTGDFPLLTQEERLRGIEVAHRACPEDRALIVNVGSMTTRQSLLLIRSAVGGPRPADLLLAGPPYYYQGTLTEARLRAHLTTLAEAAGDVPLLYYHIPRVSHFDAETEMIERAMASAGVRGIKDSDGDLDFQRALRGRFEGRPFTQLSGHLGVVLETWEAGGDGAILGVAAALPRQSAELWRLWGEGKREEAEALRVKMLVAWNAAKGHGNAGIRALLRHFAPGTLPPEVFVSGRRPFDLIAQEDRVKIERAVRESGLVG